MPCHNSIVDFAGSGTTNAHATYKLSDWFDDDVAVCSEVGLK